MATRKRSTSVATARGATHARAQQELAAADPVMAGLITRFGNCTLWRVPRAPFPTLCSAIIGQQISSRAAATVEARVLAALQTDVLTATHLLLATEDTLRSAGLSRAKVRYLRALAEASAELDWRAMQAMDDQAVTAQLTAIPGIGPWTAEMFLIFVLQRPDVFSLADVGLRGAINRLYADGEKLNAADTQAIASAWSPWRSVASWYLWRLADGDVSTWQ